MLQSLLKELVSCDTRYSNKCEKNSYGVIAAHLKKAGIPFKTVNVDGRPNILADNGKPGKAILFYAHSDTVGVLPGWKTDPFRLVIKNDRAYGLGTYDMKGGMAALLTAFAAAKKHVKMLIAVDEENISEGAWHVVKKEKRFFKDVILAISAEPNFGMGIHSVTTGRTGRMLFRAVSKGKPVHIAHYKKGVNAIYPLVQFINGLKEMRFKDLYTVLQPRSVRSDVVGMSLCHNAEVDIEVLIGALDSPVSLLRELNRLAKSVKGDIHVALIPRKTPYLAGYQFDEFPYKSEIAKIIKKNTHKTMECVHRSSVGDDNVIASLGIPVVTWGPDGGGAHEANEWVSLQSLEIMTRMYSELL